MTHVKINRMHLDVVGCVVMLCVVVSKVGFSRGPVDGKLALVNSVWNPMESHVHSLGPLEFVVMVGKATGGGVICDNLGGGLLFVANLLEDLSDEDRLLAIVE